MITNKLKLNDSKTEFLIIAPKFHRTRLMQTQPSIIIGDECITPSTSVRNLGATFDSAMSMDIHTNITVRNIFFYIRKIGKIRGHLDQATAAKVTQALIISRLDQNNSLLAGTSAANIHRLQVAQNTAARVLTRTKRSEHITPTLRELHWLPVERRIIFKVLLQVFKALNNDSFPHYISDLIRKYEPGRSLRSGDSHQLGVPRTHNTYGDRTFAKCAPSAWNALPLNLRMTDSLVTFKKNLKTYLFA